MFLLVGMPKNTTRRREKPAKVRNAPSSKAPPLWGAASKSRTRKSNPPLVKESARVNPQSWGNPLYTATKGVFGDIIPQLRQQSAVHDMLNSGSFGSKKVEIVVILPHGTVVDNRNFPGFKSTIKLPENIVLFHPSERDVIGRKMYASAISLYLNSIFGVGGSNLHTFFNCMLGGTCNEVLAGLSYSTPHIVGDVPNYHLSVNPDELDAPAMGAFELTSSLRSVKESPKFGPDGLFSPAHFIWNAAGSKSPNQNYRDQKVGGNFAADIYHEVPGVNALLTQKEDPRLKGTRGTFLDKCLSKVSENNRDGITFVLLLCCSSVAGINEEGTHRPGHWISPTMTHYSFNSDLHPHSSKRIVHMGPPGKGLAYSAIYGHEDTPRVIRENLTEIVKEIRLLAEIVATDPVNREKVKIHVDTLRSLLNPRLLHTVSEYGFPGSSSARGEPSAEANPWASSPPSKSSYGATAAPSAWSSAVATPSAWSSAVAAPEWSSAVAAKSAWGSTSVKAPSAFPVPPTRTPSNYLNESVKTPFPPVLVSKPIINRMNTVLRGLKLLIVWNTPGRNEVELYYLKNRRRYLVTELDLFL